MNEEKILKIMEELKENVRYKTIVPNEERNEWKREFDAIQGLLDLYYKQQKEIEELEDKNKTLERLLQGNLYEMYKYYRELANSYQANCISKDKIKEKIEELDKAYEDSKNDDGESEYYYPNHTIEILEELLGE